MKVSCTSDSKFLLRGLLLLPLQKLGKIHRFFGVPSGRQNLAVLYSL